MTTERSIKLKWSCSPYKLNVTDGIRIRIEVDEAIGMPSKIFAYQSLPMRPSTNEVVHAFDHVASIVDCADYPEDTPIPNSRPDWLRKDFVDLLLRSDYEANLFLQRVIADVRALKYTLDVCDTLQPTGTQWIGPEPAGTSSSIGSL